MNCTRLDELLDIEFGKISSETREEFDRETEDFCLAQTFNPNRFIRLLRANETIFLSVSLLLGYNGTFSLSQKSKDMFT